MKTFLAIIFCCLLTMSTMAQTKLFVHPDAENYVANTKTLAIIPMKTTIKLRPKELKDFTLEQIQKMEKDEALSTQEAMYSWFLTRRKRDQLLVDVQNPVTTNALLKKANIEPFEAMDQIPSELCEILGVEVVITGSLETSKPMSNAAALGLAVLGIAGSTQNATLNMNFTHKDNEVVVNYFKNVKGGLGSSSNDLINILMRKVSRRIPYTTE